jgi:hypothetical protein
MRSGCSCTGKDSAGRRPFEATPSTATYHHRMPRDLCGSRSIAGEADVLIGGGPPDVGIHPWCLLRWVPDVADLEMEPVMLPGDAFFGPVEIVPAEAAAGRGAAKHRRNGPARPRRPIHENHQSRGQRPPGRLAGALLSRLRGSGAVSARDQFSETS